MFIIIFFCKVAITKWDFCSTYDIFVIGLGFGGGSSGGSSGGGYGGGKCI